MLSNLREQIYRYRIEYLKDSAKYMTLIQEHEEIYQSLLKRDEEAALKATIVHVENQATAVKEVIIRQN